MDFLMTESRIDMESMRLKLVANVLALTLAGCGNGRPQSEVSCAVEVVDVDDVVALAAGDAHTCALLAEGRVRCWELAEGDSGTDGLTAVDVQGLTGAVALAAGDAHTCALLDDGQVSCWGLGDGTSGSTTPTAVENLNGAVAIAAGGYHTCALLDDGQVNCWGQNYSGQLGDGTWGEGTSLPVRVEGIDGAVALTAGSNHTCAILEDGQVNCWGDKSFGQLGDGTEVGDSRVPVQVQGLSNAVALTAGSSHTCAILDSGQVSCWGMNYSGQLGDGTSGGTSTVPVRVRNLSGVVALTAGYSHTCSLGEDGRMHCWGGNDLRQLGDGTQRQRSTPVEACVSGVVAFAAGGYHTCALLDSGRVNCWGRRITSD